MIPIPISDEVFEAVRNEDPSANRMVIGEAGMNPADPDAPMPCEYIVLPSKLYRGRHLFTVLVELNDEDRAAVARGAKLALTLDGGELPWTLRTVEL